MESDRSRVAKDALLAMMDECFVLGAEKFYLTGGEPMLRRDLLDLIEGATERSLAIPIDILSDATSEVLKKYRLWFAVPAEVKTLYLEKFGLNLEKYNGAGRWELPVPATYVLDRDGIVRAGEADPDYTVRMEPAEVVAAVRKIAAG